MVLPAELVAGADAEGFDLYLPSSQRGPAPVTVLVHGGPMRETPLVPGFRPSAELGTAARLPILLTRVGLEIPELAAAQQDFVDTAQAQARI